MKKLTLLFLLFGALTARGQDYIPMAVEDATWLNLMYYETGDPWHYFGYKIKGDTVINDTTYKKVYYRRYESDDGGWPLLPLIMSEEYYCAALRDNLEQRKVYVRQVGLCGMNEEEIVLYDFDLQVGESTSVMWCLISQYVEVTDEFCQTSFGQPRRVLECFDNNVCYTYISEGIGTMYSLFSGYCFDPNSSLEHFCIGPDSICLQDYLAPVSVNPINEETLRIYPNPAKDFISLELKKQVGSSNALIEIINIEGKIVHREPADRPELKINIEKLQPGMYYLRLKQNFNTIGTAVFIKQ